MTGKNEVSYKERRNNIYKDNEMYLFGFELWLKNKGLSTKTINMHVTNLAFYLNDYLCYYDLIEAHQGCRAYHIHGFLGSWFIRKAAWSSSAHIKSNAAGIKKFYEYLLEEDFIEQEDYDDLCDTIKEFMPDWLEEMRRYEEMIFEEY